MLLCKYTLPEPSLSLSISLPLMPAMVHRCALDCSMLWAGALWIALTWGLLLGPVLGGGVEQKEAELPVDGSMSFRLN